MGMGDEQKTPRTCDGIHGTRGLLATGCISNGPARHRLLARGESGLPSSAPTASCAPTPSSAASTSSASTSRSREHLTRKRQENLKSAPRCSVSPPADRLDTVRQPRRESTCHDHFCPGLLGASLRSVKHREARLALVFVGARNPIPYPQSCSMGRATAAPAKKYEPGGVPGRFGRVIHMAVAHPSRSSRMPGAPSALPQSLNRSQAGFQW
jgi:hypothetical protein